MFVLVPHRQGENSFVVPHISIENIQDITNSSVLMLASVVLAEDLATDDSNEDCRSMLEEQKSCLLQEVI